MKILRISLRNLASLAGTHTVDFTREPLRSTGIFAISGPTGSGKSTLLDALCLALYERTPRLTSVRGTVKLADGAGEISQKDPGTLLRRGTGEGFAETAFVGVDGETYTARWQVRRARGKAENALQPTEMVLWHGDVPPGQQGLIAQGGRKTEVLPFIAEKVGLSFEQFTRAVLLAQNDFATFLKAEDRDRAEILQALTGTGRFETISRQVFARCSAEEKAVQEIESRLAGNAPLSTEGRAAAEAARATEEAALKTALDRLAESEKQDAWFKRLADLTTDVGRAGEKLEAARQLWTAGLPRQTYLDQASEAAHAARPMWTAEQQADAAAKAAETRQAAAQAARQKGQEARDARMLKHAEATKLRDAAHAAQAAAQPDLRAARDLDSRLAPLAERLRKAGAERQVAETAVKAAQAERDELDRAQALRAAEQKRNAAQRAALAALAPFAPEATAWLERLDHAHAARIVLAGGEKDFAHRAKAAAALSREAAAAKVEEEKARVEVARLRTALDTASVAAKEHDGEQIAARRTALAAAREALQRLAAQLQELAQHAALVESLHREIAQLQSAGEADLRKAVDLREQQLPAAEAALAATRAAYEQARAEVDAATVSLREMLSADAPCPVCGGLDHPYAGHPPAMEAVALAALRKTIGQREKDGEKLRAALAGLDAARDARLVQSREKTGALEAEALRLASLRETAPGHPEAVALAARPEPERLPATEERLRQIVEQLQTVEAADAARRAAEKRREAGQADWQKGAELLAVAEKHLAGLAADLARAEAAHEAARTTREAQSQAAAARQKALASLFTALREAEEEFTRDAPAFREKLAAELAALLDLEKRHGELTQAAADAGSTLLRLETAFVKAGNDFRSRQTEEAAARADHEALLQKRAALFAGRAADLVEAELKTRAETTARELAERAAEVAEASTVAATTKQAAGDAEAGFATTLRERAAAAAALETWLTAFAGRQGRACDRAALEKMLAHDEAWFRDERTALVTLDHEVKKAEGTLTAHVSARDAHQATRAAELPEDDGEAVLAAALATQRAVAAEAGAQCDAARAVLHADDRRLVENAELIRQLQARRALADPWQKLNELIGSADGAKFRNIAQRHTLDLLLGYANAQLDQLAPRYRLERIPQSLNLLVLDCDMGDERRSVHTLSGGESFLVSLALALGLASLTSQRLRIESLFIDEGFGSLDPETLNIAMGALMHLEAQGRKVGVISHVAEMADAIPVQIQVVKGRGGASQLMVPGASVVVQPVIEAANIAAASDVLATMDSFSAAVAAQILAILQRAAAAGETKLSSRALRSEIGCTPAEFAAGRDALGGQIKAEGKSLMLNA